jgi:hypothetical protein
VGRQDLAAVIDGQPGNLVEYIAILADQHRECPGSSRGHDLDLMASDIALPVANGDRE